MTKGLLSVLCKYISKLARKSFISAFLVLMITGIFFSGRCFSAERIIEKFDSSKFMIPKNIVNFQVIDRGEDIDISLIDCVRTYNYAYQETFFSILETLVSSNIDVFAFDYSDGYIKAKLGNGKEFYIMILSSKENMTHVRITPIDGVYNFKMETVKDILDKIERQLAQSSVKTEIPARSVNAKK